MQSLEEIVSDCKAAFGRMSVEDQFGAAVKVIQNLPKEGEKEMYESIRCLFISIDCCKLRTM